MNEKVYEKYAWIVFFVIGAMVLVCAVPHALGSTQTHVGKEY